MYTVPVIPPDLRHEETIIQAAIALDCLQKTINSVFDRIDNRTQRNNAKVQELSTRIEKVQSKIRSLVGTKKAIKMYSPARFPSTQTFHDIPQTFTECTQEHLGYDNISIYEVHGRVDALATQAQQEKLVFFHVRYKDTDIPMHGHTVAANKAQVNKSIGMGVIPENLRSISSLLHCNRDELVYGNDTEKDLKRAKLFKSSRQRQENSTTGSEQKQLLEPAPYSLAHRNQKINSFGGLRYTPRLHGAPEIDLPLDLPDLPGIADDIHFEGKDQQQIAPSLYIENLPDLPELEEAGSVDAKNIPSGDQAVEYVPPPPPPPLTPKAPTIKKNLNSMQVAGVVTVTPPPPPPPPPPPALVKPSSAKAKSTIEHTKSVNTSAPQPNTDKSRNELMDAIRKAGGARGGRLRAAAAAPVDVVDNRLGNKSSDTKSKTGTGSTGGGDLMADLHNKLLMRRKGISGAKDKENTNSVESIIEKTNVKAITAGNPVMSRLSALIPPPARQKQSDDEDDNDADWME